MIWDSGETLPCEPAGEVLCPSIRNLTTQFLTIGSMKSTKRREGAKALHNVANPGR